MKRLVVHPEGWPCSYAECRPGLFLHGNMIGLKSEYGGEGYCDSGEAFAKVDGDVQPVTYVWEFYEE